MTTSSKRTNFQPPVIRDNHQFHLADQSNEFVQRWAVTRKSVQGDEDHVGDVVSADRMGRHSFDPVNNANNTSPTNCAYNMLLPVEDGVLPGGSVIEIDSECWSDRFGGRNLLTLSNDHYEFAVERESGSDIFKIKDHVQFSCNEFDSGQSFRLGGQTHSHDLLARSYDYFVDIGEGLGPDIVWDRQASDSWYSMSCETSGCSAISNVKDSAELNSLEIRDESSPLLLAWGSAHSDMQDIDYEVYPPPSGTESDLHSKGFNTPLNTYGSIFSSTSLLSSPSSTVQDHHTQVDCWLQQKDAVARSRSAAVTLLYGSEELVPVLSDNADRFTDTCGDSRFYVIPEDNIEKLIADNIFPTVGNVPQGLDTHLELKCYSLTDFSEQLYDDYAIRDLLRREKLSSQFHQEDEISLAESLSDEGTLMNPDNPAEQQVFFPLLLHRIKWLDTIVETCSDDHGISAHDHLL